MSWRGPEQHRDRAATRIAVFSCNGKERFATKAKAVETIRRRQRRAKHRFKGGSEKRREVSRLGAYKCDFCHHWHVGGHHDPKDLR